jgi:ankyrin repeat protein
MKKNIYWLVILLVIKSTLVFSNDFTWDFDTAVKDNDIKKMEMLLAENKNNISVLDKRLVMNSILSFSKGENTFKILELVGRYNINPNSFDLYNAINISRSDDIIQFMLDKGVKPDGEIFLKSVEKKRFNLARIFIGMGVDINYRYPPNNKGADGMSALLYAALWEDFEMIKILVENGADINLRANNGSTAASIAYTKKAMPIYNYLKEHGAVEFEQKSVADSGKDNSSTGISSILNNQAQFTLQSGTYRLIGGMTEIRISGNNKAGAISYTNNQGGIENGTFAIDGNILVLTIKSIKFNYILNSNTSFSGNAERWERIGN